MKSQTHYSHGSLILPTFMQELKSERPMYLMLEVQEINSFHGIRIFTDTKKLKAKINLPTHLMAWVERKENEGMGDLIGMIQEKFADCLTEKEVCQLYAEIRLETEKQMEYMLEQIKESEE